VNVAAIVVGRLPIGVAESARLFSAATEQVARRVIGPTPIPQRRQAVRSSEFSGEVGPREKIRYVVDHQELEPGRRHRMANTLIGATFFVAKGGRRRRQEAAAGFRMESKPRFTRVMRYPRPSRAPGVYGGV